MNALHWTLLTLTGVFVLLYVLLPARGHRAAWVYLRYLVLSLAAVLMLAPFAWLVCAAFKDRDVLMEYTFLPPPSQWLSGALNLESFRELFRPHTSVQGTIYFWRYILNSLFLSSAATALQMFFSSLGGFALARYEFRGRKALMLYMIGTMMIPPILLLAPRFELIYRIGWMDSYLALLVPGATSVFGMFLFRQAMLSIPESLIEAARVDGCSEFGIYWRIVMPLVRPMTAAFCLIVFLGTWNQFIAPQLYLHTRSMLTLPVILNQLVGIYQQKYGVFLAGTFLAIIPPAILFLALQREFISGLTRGAVKG